MFRPAFNALRPAASRSVLRAPVRREVARAFSTSLRHQAGGGQLYPVTQPPHWPSEASRNNATGTDAEVLDRFKIREICEGWGCYRDAAEWENYRSMFWDDAYIATSWKQGSIDEFIKASKDGFARGKEFMYIMHRLIGQTVDVQGNRAVSKMKVTITCRFTFNNIEVDNEADCRFFFMLEKREGRWGICFYTLLFDKDKMIPVHPGRTFDIPEKDVMKYPSGYRYLAWLEDQIDTPPKLDLNSHGPERDILYKKCKDWLEGKVVKPNLTGTDTIDKW
ncbi:Pea pathogenicity protein 2 [Lasiodiplodia hormozganensis]|uniref:Pea pathogenicity protein 2 n=1 Tax=Lasiodiplodia hormozganensis TaxID=869390 RepID=A0AA39Z4J4_9PEZI|nr:Pea pathogenicity protein 2 [Lasiodiplodia hormozganensis]